MACAIVVNVSGPANLFPRSKPRTAETGEWTVQESTRTALEVTLKLSLHHDLFAAPAFDWLGTAKTNVFVEFAFSDKRATCMISVAFVRTSQVGNAAVSRCLMGIDIFAQNTLATLA